MAFKIAYVHDYIKKLYRKLAEVIQNHSKTNVHATEKEEAMQRWYAYDC
jgi:hypothetical protein